MITSSTHFLKKAELRKLVTFEELWEQGWKTLIPIIPPGAKLSPRSKIPPDQIGKVPGIYSKQSGGWGGLTRWHVLKPTREDYRHWEAMGASIGCRCDDVVGLDCDIPDKELSIAVLEALRTDANTGIARDAPFRIGRSPKWLLPLRVPGGTRSRNFTFTHPRVPDRFRFQILGRGQQWVLWGIHPGTGELYKWSSNQRPPMFNSLPTIDADRLEAIQTCVVRTLEALGASLVQSSTSGQGAENVNQEQLKGDPELVAEALRLIPNNLEYDDWQMIAAALRGASQDWPEKGLELFLAFSERCTRVEPNLADAQRKYLSYRPPFRLGAQYIYDHAAAFGFNKAVADFEPPPPSAKPAKVDRDAVRDAVRWGEDPTPMPAQAASEQSHWSDQAIANRFVEAHRERLVYVGERGLWHAWDGQRFKPDTTRSVHDLLLQQHLFAEAVREKNRAAETVEEKEEQARLVKRLMSATMHQNIARLIRPPLTISQDVLDADWWALNTPGGLIDLRTGQPVELNRRRYVTRITRVAPSEPGSVAKTAPRWVRFLREVTQEDDELIAWLQRALGYTLAGTLPEEVLFFLWGPGGNGKGVLLHVVKEILGSYATTADRSVFLKSKFSEHATVRASLAGARMIVVPEIPSGAEWNDALLKEFSAGDPVKARFIGRDEFEFKPQGTLWFSGNDKPRFEKIDPAIERRFRLVTFEFRPQRPDIHLKSHLIEKEGPAILRWLLDGYLAWQLEGLGTAKAVEQATAEYFADNDPIRCWARDCCTLDANEMDGSSELFESYLRWWKENLATGKAGEALTQVQFVERVKRLPGVRTKRTADKRFLSGICRKMRAVN